MTLKKSSKTGAAKKEKKAVSSAKSSSVKKVVPEKKTKQSLPIDMMPGDDHVLVTKEGLEKLKQELEYLKSEKRHQVAARLKEAISYGDLSENSEYAEAKEEQAFTEGRILELEKQVKHAKIITDQKTKTVAVRIGSTVKVQNKTLKEEHTYVIVGSTEADLHVGRISNESPVGNGLLGKSVGDVAKITIPAGMHEYKVLKIS